jgi:hypothetical protein
MHQHIDRRRHLHHHTVVAADPQRQRDIAHAHPIERTRGCGGIAGHIGHRIRIGAQSHG